MLWLDYYWHKVLKRPYTLAKRIDRGRGQPVIFLHGIASTGEGWRSVAEQLDDTKYRSIVFDLLGFGDSPQPDWLQYSVDDHAKLYWRA
jgi:Predicted hydrolases or acyltransferases (alpha/beta hydrolase superfamily)